MEDPAHSTTLAMPQSLYSYLPFLLWLDEVATSLIVGDVEGMVTSLITTVIPTFHNERVLKSSVKLYLWYEESIEVPRDTPPTDAYMQ